MGAVFEHATFTRHEIILANDPVTRMMGFSCSECTGNDTVWEIPLTALYGDENTLGQVLRTADGTREFLRMVNQDATNPMFEIEYSGPTVQLAPGEEVERLEALHMGEVNAEELADAQEDHRVRLEQWRTTRFQRREPV